MTAMWRRRGTTRDRWVAFDLETTGLDPRRDGLVALGLVPVSAGRVRWGERFYSLIADPRVSRPLGGEALGTHQILPAEARRGLPLAAALDRLETLMAAGAAFLVHGAGVESRFWRAAARFLGRRGAPGPMLDTLDYLLRLERHRLHLGSRLPAAGRVAVPTLLAQARAFFGLPPYPAHHALTDALATAELYLLLARRFPELHPSL